MLKSLSELDRPNVECPICFGLGWVCENHQDKPWADMDETLPGACACGAGAPCKCNVLLHKPEGG
jgi:hypothetical protein